MPAVPCLSRVPVLALHTVLNACSSVPVMWPVMGYSRNLPKSGRISHSPAPWNAPRSSLLVYAQKLAFFDEKLTILGFGVCKGWCRDYSNCPLEWPLPSASYNRPLVVVSLSTINRHYLADEFIGSIIDIWLADISSCVWYIIYSTFLNK